MSEAQLNSAVSSAGCHYLKRRVVSIGLKCKVLNREVIAFASFQNIRIFLLELSCGQGQKYENLFTNIKAVPQGKSSNLC